MKAEACWNCKYYANSDSVGYSECRRHAPIVENLVTTDIYMDRRKSFFPVVQDFCWCGDWCHSDGRTKGYDFLDNKIEDCIDFSLRVSNIFNKHGIDSLRNLTAHTEYDLLQFEGFGRTCLWEVKKRLDEFQTGLSLKKKE